MKAIDRSQSSPDGSRLFDRDKLARSLGIATRKRPVTDEQIEQLITRTLIEAIRDEEF